ncbi:MAG: FtsQ-type POTRA domain-containing protein, partial [Mycobacteriales bacterium]
ARARRTGWVAAGVLPLLLLAWLLGSSSLLAVRQVVVSGEHRLTAEQIEAAADVAPGTPLARVDTAAVARRVRALGPVASVAVTRGWPHALRIKVTERVPVAALTQRRGFLLLDGGGAVIAPVATLPRGTYRLEAPAPDAPATQAALTVLRQLPRALRAQLVAVRAATPEQVTLVLRDGRTVLWGGVDDSPAKAAAVLALMKMPGTVFDVSAPGVVTRR